MRKIKQLNGWGIFENNRREFEQYGFMYTVVHPDNMGVPGLTPADSDWECDTLEQAEEWVENYDEA